LEKDVWIKSLVYSSVEKLLHQLINMYIEQMHLKLLR